MDPAGATELKPLVDEVPLRVEDLDPVVLTICNKQPPPRVELEAVDLVELARSHPLPTPRLDELAIPVELHDPRVSGLPTPAAVSIRHVDITVGSDRDLGRGIELVVTGSGYARRTQRHDELAARIELQHLVATTRCGSVVGDPDVAVTVDRDLVRTDDRPTTEAL